MANYRDTLFQNEEPIPGVQVRLYDVNGKKVAADTTDVLGNYFFTNLPQGNYEVRFFGEDFTSDDYVNFAIAGLAQDQIEAREDTEIQTLISQFLTISWSSVAILDTFVDSSIQGTLPGGLKALVLIDGQLVVPAGAAFNDDYWYYSKTFTMTSGGDEMTKATLSSEYTKVGTGDILLESTFNNETNWFTWIDTSDVSSGPDYPNGYLDRTAIEKIEPTDFVKGQVGRVRIKISTDAVGLASFFNFYGIIASPNLYTG